MLINRLNRTQGGDKQDVVDLFNWVTPSLGGATVLRLESPFNAAAKTLDPSTLGDKNKRDREPGHPVKPVFNAASGPFSLQNTTLPYKDTVGMYIATHFAVLSAAFLNIQPASTTLQNSIRRLSKFARRIWTTPLTGHGPGPCPSRKTS